MFEQTFVKSRTPARKPWTVGASLAIQSTVVGAALMAPLMHIAALEFPARDAPLFVSLKPLGPAPEQIRAATPVHAVHPFRNPLIAPMRIPARTDPAPDAPEPPALDRAGNPGALSGAVPMINLADGPIATPPPSKPTAAKPEVPKPAAAPVRISSGVQAANLIYAPKPVYPALAKAARVQGTVKLQAIIDADGSIGNLKVLSGPPLLVNAAIDAVQRWRYRPTLLNGAPVEVITDIDVNFTLN